MPRINQQSVDKLKDTVSIADRYGTRPPVIPVVNPSGDKPPALIGRIDSGPDDNGLWTGRLVKFDVYTQAWVVTSEFDVKFMRTNSDDAAPTIGRRYACRPSHINIDDADTSIREYVFNLLSGGNGQEYVIITEPLGTGTWNLQGRSIARVTTYDVETDSWTLGRFVLVEPLNTGVFIDNRRYAASYAGEDTGGYDGTGTGTLGTGTTGTISVYLADPMGVRLDVITDITVECVAGNIVTTITRKTIIAIIEP
jgi:hypothetical protein